MSTSKRPGRTRPHPGRTTTRPSRSARGPSGPPTPALGFLVFCAAVLVVSLALLGGDVDVDTQIWCQIGVGGAYGALLMITLARSEREQRRRTSVPARCGLAGAYLGALLLAWPAAPDHDAAMTLAFAPLLHLIGVLSGLCVAALAGIGVMALWAAVRVPEDGSTGLRHAARAFAVSLAVIVLALVPAATLDTLAYDSPYDGRRSPDWPLLLFGVERFGVAVHHPAMLIVARVLWWAIVLAFGVLAGLFVTAWAHARRRTPDPEPPESPESPERPAT